MYLGLAAVFAIQHFVVIPTQSTEKGKHSQISDLVENFK